MDKGRVYADFIAPEKIEENSSKHETIIFRSGKSKQHYHLLAIANTLTYNVYKLV